VCFAFLQEMQQQFCTSFSPAKRDTVALGSSVLEPFARMLETLMRSYANIHFSDSKIQEVHDKIEGLSGSILWSCVVTRLPRTLLLQSLSFSLSSLSLYLSPFPSKTLSLSLSLSLSIDTLWTTSRTPNGEGTLDLFSRSIFFLLYFPRFCFFLTLLLNSFLFSLSSQQRRR
jgi:hypothetical protein